MNGCCVDGRVVIFLRLQAEYREKRRQYLTQFDGVPPELYSADLVDYNCFPVSSSSSGDQDGVPSSPGVLVTVSRQDSVSSGDAFVDVHTSCTPVFDSRLAAGDREYRSRDGARGKVDGWSMRSLPGGGDDQDDDAELGIDQKSVSASDPNFQTHYEWLSDTDDAAVGSERQELDDVVQTPEVEELDLDVSENQTIIREPSTTTADVTQSSGLELTPAIAPTDETPTDDVESGLRLSPSSSLSPSHHQRLSASEMRLVNKQLLLNSTVLEASYVFLPSTRILVVSVYFCNSTTD